MNDAAESVCTAHDIDTVLNIQIDKPLFIGNAEQYTLRTHTYKLILRVRNVKRLSHIAHSFMIGFIRN